MNNFKEYTITFKAHVVARAGNEIKPDLILENLERRLVLATEGSMLIGATSLKVEEFE